MSKPVDRRHAQYVGWMLGIARRAGLPAQPVLDDAGYCTDEISFPAVNSDINITVVVPPPPEDWTPE